VEFRSRSDRELLRGLLEEIERDRREDSLRLIQEAYIGNQIMIDQAVGHGGMRSREVKGRMGIQMRLGITEEEDEGNVFDTMQIGKVVTANQIPGSLDY
jgi:hypothetical protein